MVKSTGIKEKINSVEERQRKILNDIEYYNRLNEDRVNRQIAEMRICEYLRKKEMQK